MNCYQELYFVRLTVLAKALKSMTWFICICFTDLLTAALKFKLSVEKVDLIFLTTNLKVHNTCTNHKTT